MRLIRKHPKDKLVKNIRMMADIDVPALKSFCYNASLHIKHQSTLTLKQPRAEVRFTDAAVHLGIVRCHTNNLAPQRGWGTLMIAVTTDLVFRMKLDLGLS